MGEPTIGSPRESSTDTSDEQPVALLWLFGNAATADIWMHHTGDILLQSGRRRIGTVAGVPFGFGLAGRSVRSAVAEI
ncbi:hypothetical protein [Rhodococcus sp. 21391]|uniref:hypothetical protein n=1 Tax=Rhodococcus sp. 21391 TaxID=2683591 RepID=UPI000B2464E7|nr:hypothetical protein [Rhodococcus sp. 21391]QQZ18484.1 hypothetical protein GO592_40670 [Rhodococcus sp. 21391]